MKRKVLIVWILVHLIIIVLVNITGAYGLYCEYYEQKPDAHSVVQIARLLNTIPLKYYGRYSGAESGYGFFGMNVRSNGLLIGECNGNKLSPEFTSYESSLRFFCLSSSVTDNWIRPGALQKDSAQDYNNLVLKNIAVTLFQKGQCADTAVQLSYNILSFPSLAEIKQGAPKKYQMLKLVNMRYGIH